MKKLSISLAAVLAIVLAVSSAFAPKAPFTFTYEVYTLPSSNTIDPSTSLPDAGINSAVVGQGSATSEFIAQNDALSAWYAIQEIGVVCNFEEDEKTCLAKVRHDETSGPDVVVELLPGEFQD